MKYRLRLSRLARRNRCSAPLLTWKVTCFAAGLMVS
jgi:hypothetical protein